MRSADREDRAALVAYAALSDFEGRPPTATELWRLRRHAARILTHGVSRGWIDRAGRATIRAAVPLLEVERLVCSEHEAGAGGAMPPAAR